MSIPVFWHPSYQFLFSNASSPVWLLLLRLTRRLLHAGPLIRSRDASLFREHGHNILDGVPLVNLMRNVSKQRVVRIGQRTNALEFPSQNLVGRLMVADELPKVYLLNGSSHSHSLAQAIRMDISPNVLNASSTSAASYSLVGDCGAAGCCGAPGPAGFGN